MSIPINSNFELGAPLPIDKKMTLTYEQMAEMNDNIMPSVYFTICIDDGCLYLYNKNNIKTAETGRFIKLIDAGSDAGKTTPKGTQYTIDGTTYTVGDNAEVFNDYSNNKAIGNCSHTEGGGTTALGNYSHAEGGGTTASGQYAHSEGASTKATEINSHAEGGSTTASGVCSHAEGMNTTASRYGSHSEGGNTTARGDCSHAEGVDTIASGNYSHAEGNGTSASGSASHAEGRLTTASGNYSHTEGENTTASADYSHAEGASTTASGIVSHAEGGNTSANSVCSHAEGAYTIASSDYQHVQGKYNVEDSSDKYAFIIGNGSDDDNRSNAFAVDWNGLIYVNNSATGVDVSQLLTEEIYNAGKALVKGTSYTIDGRKYTVADCAEVFNDYENNIATGEYSRAEGKNTRALGGYSHAEGRNTIASGHYSHAEGYNTIAEGNYSHSEGYGTICGSPYQHVQGKYNIQDNNSKYAYILGNGTDNSNRSNVIAIDWNGKIYVNNATTGVDVSNDLQTKITSTNKLNSDLVDDTNQNNKFVTSAEKTKIANALTEEVYNAGKQVITVNNIGVNLIGEIFNNYSGNKATKNYSHAEGSVTTASGESSHAEGSGTTASGECSHAEGSYTTASGNTSHAEGSNTIASGYGSHAEGVGTTASGYSSHAEGCGTIATSIYQHAQGKFNVEDSNSKYAFIIGNGTDINNRSNAFAVDWDGLIYVNNSATGVDVSDLLTEEEYNAGKQVTTNSKTGEIFNDYSRNAASGNYSHAEGYGTKAIGDNSHAEGASTTARGSCGHAEGSGCHASGNYSHAEGGDTVVIGHYSHVEGQGTRANSLCQHAQGKYNIEDSNNKYAFIIGNGTSTNARSNAFAVDWDGKIYVNNSATGVDVSNLATRLTAVETTIGNINAVLEEVL